MKLISRDHKYNIKRKIYVLTLVFSSLLLLDILLGVQVSEEEIKYRTYERQRTGGIRSPGTKTVLGIITDKNEYPVSELSFYNDAKIGDRILVYKTRILGEVTEIRIRKKTYLDPVYSIYAFYCLFPILCFTSSFCALILDIFRQSYFDFFLALSSVLSAYLLISILTNRMI